MQDQELGTKTQRRKQTNAQCRRYWVVVLFSAAGASHSVHFHLTPTVVVWVLRPNHRAYNKAAYRSTALLPSSM